ACRRHHQAFQRGYRMSQENQEQQTDDQPDQQKLFTQDEVNAINANYKRNLQARVAELETQLAERPVANSADVESAVAVERGKWQSQFDEMTDAHSKALAARDVEWSEKFNNLQGEFNAGKISQAILSAAVTGEAINPEQLRIILGPHAAVDDSGSVVIN